MLENAMQNTKGNFVAGGLECPIMSIDVAACGRALNPCISFFSLIASIDIFQVCDFPYLRGGKCHKNKWEDYL